MIENGILKADGVNGISNYEVAQVLGAGSLDVGTLCTHPNINKWSEDKPVALNATAEPNFKDTLKDIKELGYDMKNFQQGLYKKPYGVYPAKLTGIDSAGVGLPKSDVWEYVRLEKGQLAGNENKVVWATTTPNGQRVESERWARLSDFDGYNHLAIPPVKVEWLNEREIVENELDPETGNDVDVTKQIGGVFAKITVPKADSGSISFKDLMGKNTAYALFVMIDKDNRYVYGNTSNIDASSTTEVSLDFVNGLVNGKASDIVGISNRTMGTLSGRYKFAIVIADKVISYAQGSDSWDSGFSIFYPIAAAYPTVSDSTNNGYVVEGGMTEKQVNSVQGTTLFMTDNIENKYAFVDNAIGLEEGVHSEFYTRFTFPVAATTLKYMADIRVTEKVASLMRGVIFRSDELTSTSATIDIASMRNYLVYCFDSNGVREGYKPLLMGLKVKNANGQTIGYEVDIFIHIIKNADKTTNAKQYIKYQVRSSSGNAVLTNTLFEYSGEIGDVLWFIGFWNETNNRGKVTGFKYGAFVGDAP